MRPIGTLTSSTVGNFTIEPGMLRRVLKTSNYFLDYDSKERMITFWTDDGSGGKVIFELTNASHENAEKIAIALGMKREGSNQVSWCISNPHFVLHHDGSDDAKALRAELLELDIPHDVVKSEELALEDGCTGIYKRSNSFNQAYMLDMIRKCAERFKAFHATP